MFFEKLWVRVKGELLSLKEDDSVTDDLRIKAGRLLNRMQDRVIGDQEDPAGTDRAEPTTSHAHEVSKRKPKELADIEAEWQALTKERDRQKDSVKDDQPLPPNPRELG